MKTTLKIICAICLTFNFISCQAPQFKKEVRRVYSLTFHGCFCQWYDLNKVEKITKLKPCEVFFEEYACTGQDTDKPDCLKPCDDGNEDNYCYDPSMTNIKYCDDLTGFSKRSWAVSITPKGKELRRFLLDYNLTKEALKNLKKKKDRH